MHYTVKWEPHEYGYSIFEVVESGIFKGEINIGGFIREGHAKEYAAWKNGGFTCKNCKYNDNERCLMLDVLVPDDFGCVHFMNP